MKIIALAAAVAIAAPALAAPRVGQPAPDFAAKAASGETIRLSNFKGKTVVLEWTNKGCPYVVKHYASDNMQTLQEKAAENGIIWLTVNSGAPGKQGHVDADGAMAEMAEYDTTQTAYLLDADGKVGKLYNASATPHMYIVAPNGDLTYMGAIDDRPTSDQGDIEGATNYVTAALDAMAAGDKPSPAATRAYGCSVKYGG
ncbi:MAG: redoxin domain-containing protein [Pacificimonas sp.]